MDKHARRNAIRAKLNLKQVTFEGEPEKPTKERVRVTWSAEGIINWPGDEPKPVPDNVVTLPIEQNTHTLGGTCPHCGGTGRYLNHSNQTRGKCFRCDGKGELNAKDLAFLAHRQQNGRALSLVYGGC